MNPKTFNQLGIGAGVMVVLSVIIGLEKPTVNFSFAKGQYLVRSLDPAQVKSITIKSKTEEVKLDKNGDNFVVTSKLSYPAARKEVNTLMRDLSKVQLAAELTTDKGAHKALGVSEDAEDAKVVKFLDAQGKEIVGVIVGKAAEGTGGYNVRLTNSDQVYRSEAYINIRDKSLDYMEKEIVNNERNQVEKVEVKPGGGQAYVIASPKEGEVKLEGIPDGKRAKATNYESVFTTTSYFSFEELASASTKQDLEFKDSHIVTRRDGAQFKFDVAKKDDKWWVRGTAAYVGPAKIAISKDDKDDVLKQKEANLKAQDAVEAFNRQHQSWVYQVGSWKAENMAKPFADLIEDVPVGPEEIGAQHILISYEGAMRSEVKGRTKEDAKKKADELLPQVQAAPDKFNDFARDNTDEPGGKEKGGDLGTFKREAMTKPFSEAAFKLEVNQVSAVVETEFGFHIIKRTK